MALVSRLSSRGLMPQALWSVRRFAAEADKDIELEVMPFLTHKVDPPSNKVTTTKSELMGFFETMYRIRRMEVASDILYKAKFIRGFCHLYDGQEAVVTGIAAGSTFKDSLITSYRDHATHLVRGGTVKEVMGELLGKTVGAVGGVGGSMHMYKRENNFYGGCGIVGAQIPLGAGLALKHKMMGEKNVAFAMYGDGASNQGQLYESINMCALWDVPCIFVCENNHYGMGTADWRGSKAPAFYKRGDYIPGIKVDGMDVLAVKKATEFAKEYAIEHGPIVMECDTYRYHGHSMSDPGSTYRTRDEVSSMRQERDPVERVRKLMLEHGLVETAELKALEKKIKKEIDDVIDECKAAPQPGLDRLNKNIYKAPLGQQLRGAVSGKWITAG